MKKSLNSALLRFLMMGGVVICIVFTACENFLDGAVLKKSVEKEIEWEKAESLSVLVTPEEGTGSTVPFGNYDCKLGYFFEVSFTENNSYSFIKWAAVSADNLSEEIEGVLFEDASSPKTTVKFARPIANVRILPVCTQRIAVSGEPSPRYEPNGVARDRSISVTFTKDLSEENFIFQPEELPQGAAAQTDDDGKIWAYVSGNQTFFKNISITNADDFSIAEHFSRPQVTGRLLTIPVDKTKPIQFNSGEVFKTIKVTLSKEISDSDNIKMNYSKSWNYLITEATDEKATVNLSGNSSEGSVYLAGTKDYSLGQKITLAFTENTDWQFIKWDYDSSVIYIDNPKSINTTAVVLEKTTEDNPTQIRAVCARRLRLAENGYEPKTSGNETVSKNSSIQLTFDQKLPADAEDRAQLANLSITVGGTPVRTCFNAPEISENTVSFTANKSNMLDVTEGQTKTVTVTIPADFYYKLDDGTKVTWGGNGFAFDYRIDSTTTQKASVVFEMETDSGTITPAAGLHEYSEGQEVAVSFVPADGWEFRGWTVKTGAGDDVPASKIKILDPDALSTKLIVYEALSDVKIRADAVLLPAVSSFTPAYESGGKDCDTPVVIVFNKAMKTDTFNLYSEADAQGMKGTIQIVNPSNEYEHYEEYFNAPSWSADGKTLTLKPKNTIRDALVKNDSDLRNIRLIFDISKVSDTDGNRLKEADASWVYRINHSMETIAPTVTMKMYKRGFDIQKNSSDEYTAVENDTYTELSSLAFTNFTAETYPLNHVGAKIYFDATVSDEGSGYKQLTINETLIKTVGGAGVTGAQTYSTTVQFDEDDFADTISQTPSNHSYTFMTTMDGLIQLDFVFEDYAGAKTTKSWYVIKDTLIESSSVFNSRHSDQWVTSDYVTDSTTNERMYYTEDNNQIRKRITEQNGDVKEAFYFDNLTDIYLKPQTNTSFKSKLTYEIKWGYSNLLGNTATKESNGNMWFTRDAKKDCFVREICWDDVGNITYINRVIPKKVTIIDYVKGSSSLTFNFTDSDSFASKVSNYNATAFNYFVVYTYQENLDSDVSGFRSDYQSYIKYFYLTNNKISASTFKPAGIYKIYIIPVFTYTGEAYLGALSEPLTIQISYENGNQVISQITESSQSTPSLPDTISYELKPAVKNAGTRDIVVTPPSGMTEGYTYGVKYNIQNDTKIKYADFTFSVKSGYKYDIYLFAKDNKTGEIYTSTSPCKGTIDAEYDNISPSNLSNWFFYFGSYPNRIRLLKNLKDGFGNVNKGLFPEDEGSEGLVKQNGLVVLDYYIRRNNTNDNKSISFVQRAELENMVGQNAYFSEEEDLVDLAWDNFAEGYYTIAIDLKDKNGNERIACSNICNIVNPIIPKMFIVDGSSLKLNGIEGSYGKYFYLLNDKWKNLREFQFSKNGAGTTVGGVTTVACNELQNQVFVEASYSTTDASGYGGGFKSTLYSYFCPSYELKSDEQKAQVCRSKSAIPGIGGAYQVYYDAPCFAHTMAFPTDMLGDLDAKLAEAKSIDSSVDDETYIKAIWETKGREYGLKLINSAWLDSASTATYTAPVSEILAGYSYVTIFHFADGTSVMSEVKQK